MTNIIEKLWKVASECEKVKANPDILATVQCRLLNDEKTPIVITAIVGVSKDFAFIIKNNKSFQSHLSHIEYLDTSDESVNAALLEVRREAFEAAREITRYMDEVDYVYDNAEDYIKQKEKEQL